MRKTRSCPASANSDRSEVLDAEIDEISVTQAEGDILAGHIGKKEIAVRLHVSERTIDRWVQLRQFPAPAKIGNLRLWQRDILRAHFEALAPNPEPRAPAIDYGRQLGRRGRRLSRSSKRKAKSE